MLSRGAPARNYGVSSAQQIRKPGTQRINADGSQSWATSRPTNSPSPTRAPLYLNTYPPQHAAQPQHNRRAMSGGERPLKLRAQVGQKLNQKSGG